MVRVRARTGAWPWLESHAMPLFGDNGEYAGHVGFSLDVTERRQYEEFPSEADRHKNEFLAMLAHELRNPLAPILASIGILRRAKSLQVAEGLDHRRAQGTGEESPHASLDLNPGVDNALNVLQRQVDQMVRLVDDLLDAARISRGKLELRRERVELSSIVGQAVEAARPLCERRNHHLTVTIPSGPIYLNADPARIFQIVNNLLNNACKFTPRGGHIWLTVERENASEDACAEAASTRLASQVAIRVRDTGIGIAADEFGHVFDLFTQIDMSLERSFTGLGIGLTLVKTFAEMHGGAVEVSSAGVGQGCEFVVCLPMLGEAEAPASPPPATEAAVTTSLRILIVDDNHDSADMLAMLLQFSGHETHTAHDGLAAVMAAAKLQPDVIFLDIGLLVLNGYEAARRIREQPQGERPVLVALTGWGQEEDRRQSRDAGFDAHMVKPI
jgi:signal transduction histidine kinase